MRGPRAVRCRWPTRSRTPSRCCLPWGTCTTGAWCTATSSQITSSRPRSSSSSSTWAGCARIDSDGPIYGTVGYQAPEIGTDGPSVSSDLFTVARALAVLTFEFKGYQGSHKFTFPDGVPLLGSRSRSPGCCAGPPTLIRTGASAPRGRWPNSSPACCARFSPWRTARPDRRSRRCSAPSSRRSGPGTTSRGPPWPRRPPRRSSRACRCRRSTGPIPPPVTWPRSPGSIPASERPRCRGPSRATRPCRPRWLRPPRRAWRWHAPSSTSAIYDGAAVTLAELAAEDPSDWRIAWTDGMRWLAASEARPADTRARQAARARQAMPPSRQRVQRGVRRAAR